MNILMVSLMIVYLVLTIIRGCLMIRERNFLNEKIDLTRDLVEQTSYDLTKIIKDLQDEAIALREEIEKIKNGEQND